MQVSFVELIIFDNYCIFHKKALPLQREIIYK